MFTFDFESDLRMLHLLQNSNAVLSSSDSLLLQDFAFSSFAPFDERRAIAEVLLDSIYRDGEMEARLSQQTEEETPPTLNPKVYPNPTHAEFWVKTPTQNAQIKVTDILGHEVFNFTSSEMLTSISTSQWAQGIYLVSITETNGLRSHFKLIKQ